MHVLRNDLATLEPPLSFDAAGYVVNASDAADLAASVQQAFEHMVRRLLAKIIPPNSAEPIVLTGGCALNIVTNDLVRREWASDIWVPAAPNDAGLSTGAAWLIDPPRAPPADRADLAFVGLPPFDASDLVGLAERHGGRRVGEAEVAAELLKPDLVAGIMRGRQEFGPRALGHRSLLAYPESREVVARLNVIKVRQSYRPVAPVVIDEDMWRIFGVSLISPFMSFAPAVLPSARAGMPALAHVDGSARVQSVCEADEPWLHSLLRRIKQSTGWGVVLNTSFNVRGRPLINRFADAIRIYEESDDVRMLLLEDWMFQKA